jgi:regulator of sigma E protease
MSVVMSVVILLVMLGVMVTLHESGHFLSARAFKVKVREFAIGMGPAFYKTKPPLDENGEPLKTKFSLRVFPIGGYCDLGEDNESSDPYHFRNQALWKRIVILCAGSVMNLVLGYLLCLIVLLFSVGMYTPTTEITAFEPEYPYTDKFELGDKIIKLNAENIHSKLELDLFLARGDLEAPMSFVVNRGGQKVKIDNVYRTVETEEGKKLIGIYLQGYEEITTGKSFGMALDSTVFYARVVWLSLGDLLSGHAAISDMAGPVGMGSAVNDIVSDEETQTRDKVLNVLNLAALITINLGVFNLLPIPALDGGRILLALIGAVYLRIRRKPINAKFEAILHTSVFCLFILLMVVVFFNDIKRLVVG